MPRESTGCPICPSAASIRVAPVGVSRTPDFRTAALVRPLQQAARARADRAGRRPQRFTVPDRCADGRRSLHGHLAAMPDAAMNRDDLLEQVMRHLRFAQGTPVLPTAAVGWLRALAAVCRG
jgi:hypothetical protein